MTEFLGETWEIQANFIRHIFRATVSFNTNMKKLIKIWDSPTRLFHWLLVLLFGFLWFSGETGKFQELHMKAGMLVLSLILYRILWGFFGSSSARFGSFISPIGTIKHALTLFKREPEIHAGHNSVGGLMVITMLVMLGLQAGAGLFSSDLILSEGPLYHLVSEQTAQDMTDFHHLGFNILLFLTGLHIVAILFYRVFKRTNLLKPMITGKTVWPDEKAEPKLDFKSPLLALAILVFSAATVFGGVTYFSNL